MTGLANEASRLHVAVHCDGDRITVALTGELDGFNGAPLTRLLETLVDGRSTHLDLQLDRLWFVDVGGVRVLLRAHQRGTDRGVTVEVRDPAPHVVWLLHTVRDAAVLLGDNAPGDAGPHHPEGPPPAIDAGEAANEVPPAPSAAARDERDRRADERDELADDRERLARERDRLVDERQQRASEHQRWEDIREDLADVRERALERREKDC